MGGALDRFVLPLLVEHGSIDCAGMGDERGDDADQRRADVYSAARIGAAAALTLALGIRLVECVRQIAEILAVAGEIDLASDCGEFVGLAELPSQRTMRWRRSGARGPVPTRPT